MATAKEATSKTDMITVEGLIKVKKQNIISIFSDNKKIEPMIKKVREEVSVEKFDLTTKKGRDDIASRAYKVSKMKNAVVKKLIDPSVEEYKAAIKGVGAGKTHWNSEMDALRDEVRAPLNKWEEEEKVREQKRVDDIKKKISGINDLAILPPEADKNYISASIEGVDNIDCTNGFDEFAQEALQAKAGAKDILSQRLNSIIQKELEAAQQLKLAEQQEELDEAQRVMEAKAKAQERLNNLIMIPSTMFGKTSVELNKKLNSIDLVEINEAEFGELFDQANAAKAQVIVQLGQMAEQQALVEKVQEERAKVESEQKQVVAEKIIDHVMAVDEKPVSQRLDETFANTPDEQSISPTNDQNDKYNPQLSQKDKLIKQLKFWQGQYGVRDTEFRDLMNIINQYI